LNRGQYEKQGKRQNRSKMVTIEGENGRSMLLSIKNRGKETRKKREK